MENTNSENPYREVELIQQDTEKLLEDIEMVIDTSPGKKTDEVVSTFDNVLDQLASNRTSVVAGFERIIGTVSATKGSSKVTEEAMNLWIEKFDQRIHQLKVRFGKIPLEIKSRSSSCSLDFLSFSPSLKHSTASSISGLSTTSSQRVKAEIAAARKKAERAEMFLKFQEEEALREEEDKLQMAHEEDQRRRREIASEKRRAIARAKKEAFLVQSEFEVMQAAASALDLDDSSHSISSSLSLRETQGITNDEFYHNDQVHHSHDIDKDDLTKHNGGQTSFKSLQETPSPLPCSGLRSCQCSSSAAVDSEALKIVLNTQRAMMFGLPTLTRFSGRTEDFVPFMATWLATAGAPGGDPVGQLQQLLSSVDEKTRESLEYFTYMEPSEGYSAAIEYLYAEFGHGDKIVDAMMEKIKGIPNVKRDDGVGLKRLSDTVARSLLALKEVSKKRPGNPNYMEKANTEENALAILSKLPQGLAKKYVNGAGEKNSTSLSAISEFLKKEAKEMNNPMLKKLYDRFKAMHESGNTGSKETKHRKDSAFFANDGGESCFICLGLHRPHKCPDFLNKTPEERRRELRNDARCFNCLEKGHDAKDCNLESFCKSTACRWEGKHSTCVHGSIVRKQVREKMESPEHIDEIVVVENTNSISLDQDKVFLKIVPIRIWSTSNGRGITCWAMLDDCSTSHFGHEKLREKLNLKGKERSCTIRTVNGIKTMKMLSTDLYIQGINSPEVITLKDTKLLQNKNLRFSSVPDLSDSDCWPQLNEVHYKNLDYNEVLVLIGANSPESHGYQRAKSGPSIVNTGLGKAIVGNVSSGNVREKGCSIETTHLIDNNYDNLSSRIDNFFRIEDCESLNDETKAMSVEDKIAFEKINKSIHKVKGHYEVRVPWRKDEPSMPNNRLQAVQRLQGLQWKFKRNPEKFMEYSKAIEQEILPESDKASWLRHLQDFKHERKKLRIIFEGSKNVKTNSASRVQFTNSPF